MAGTDPRRAAATIAGDLRRHRDTIEKLAPGESRVMQAAALIQEAAALLSEYAQSRPPVEHFRR